MTKIRVLFEVVQEYYWPAMAPIFAAMRTDPRYELFLRIGPNQKRFLGLLLVSQQKAIEEKFRRQGFTLTRTGSGFDAVICGDTLKHPDHYGAAVLCNVDHGPCFKTLRYRNLLRQPQVPYVVFAEGPYRLRKLAEHGLDKIDRVYDVGLPKLDPFFLGTYRRETIIDRHTLDPAKKIVLYAPTYKPTSLFRVGEQIHTLLGEYNVVVKLHPYSWSGKYAPHSHHRLYEGLARAYPSLCLVPREEHDIMPYLFAADTMISEASSVINEFLALDRCGIIFDLEDEKLKHSDGEALLEEKTTAWLKDSFVHISRPEDLRAAVAEALDPSPGRRAKLVADRRDIYSCVDGTSSQKVKRIIEELLAHRLTPGTAVAS
jgi:hypothetical protein